MNDLFFTVSNSFGENASQAAETPPPTT